MPDYLVAALISFIIALTGLYALIPVLRRVKFGQYVRQDGPATHLKKAGTPTMGGCVFLPAIAVAILVAGALVGRVAVAGAVSGAGAGIGAVSSVTSGAVSGVGASISVGSVMGGVGMEEILAIFLIAAMSVLGFLDDYLKIRRHDSNGLSEKQKMAGQILAALIFSAALWRLRGGWIWLPGPERFYDIGIFFIPAAAFVIVATVNGVNFTDGIDGLCSGVTFIVAVAYLLLCRAWGMYWISRLAGALAGCCIGFLCLNIHPAKVFMGDTGSLALGGAVAALALCTRTAVLLPLLGIVYVVEVASVIIQVRYFKMTGGRRIFRMSPIHHHFELGGMKELEVDIMFWLVTTAAAALFLWILLSMGY